MKSNGTKKRKIIAIIDVTNIQFFEWINEIGKTLTTSLKTKRHNPIS